ncbi:MAG TPA: glycine cleavage system aminomethyltransferase GcvT [Acidiferrobacteraceae bacterium]|nr:glycine cleavage system aminomethyltransferase GcvT [Acidiferrobacteraceae bacterium]
MGRKTPLYPEHLALAAQMVDFGGWDMPLHYGSQIEEHHAVRREGGLFDVSHMRIVELRGSGVRPYLQRLLANDVAKLQKPGKALYSCLLNADGGVRDDLIVYFLEDAWFRMVVNAATADDDLGWMQMQTAGFDVRLEPRLDLAMLAAQGPAAVARVTRTFDVPDAAALPRFHGAFFGDRFVARTGYTGEDGFELMVPAQQAASDWRALVAAGLRPAGLGARDTLRLEAGMNLYGHDMDTSVTPLESGLEWTVSLGPDRPFIGREALEQQRAAADHRQLLGVVLEGRGVLRNCQPVRTSAGSGVLTSGSFSPTLERSIGLARVPHAARAGEPCEVEIRGRWEPARLVTYPFVRNGKSLI